LGSQLRREDAATADGLDSGGRVLDHDARRWRHADVTTADPAGFSDSSRVRAPRTATIPSRHSSSARTRKASSSGVSRCGAMTRIVSWFCPPCEISEQRVEVESMLLRPQPLGARDAMRRVDERAIHVEQHGLTREYPAVRTIGCSQLKHRCPRMDSQARVPKTRAGSGSQASAFCGGDTARMTGCASACQDRRTAPTCAASALPCARGPTGTPGLCACFFGRSGRVSHALRQPLRPRLAVPLLERLVRNLAFDEELRELPTLRLTLERHFIPPAATAISDRRPRAAGPEWGSGGREFESRRPDQSNQRILRDA
jgi:hypothetical protein